MEGGECSRIKARGEVTREGGSNVIPGTVRLETTHRRLVVHADGNGGVRRGHVGSHPRGRKGMVTHSRAHGYTIQYLFRAFV